MALKRSRTWTVEADEGQIDAVIAEFAERRGIAVERGRGRIELSRGGRRAMRGREARLAREEELPLSGSIDIERSRGALRIASTLRSEGVGLFAGRGPLTGRVKHRFDQLLGELLNDLGQSLAGAHGPNDRSSTPL